MSHCRGLPHPESACLPTNEAPPHPPLTRRLHRAPFKGVLQLPRSVTYDADTHSLVLFPIEEIKTLRSKQVRQQRRSWLGQVALHGADLATPCPCTAPCTLRAHTSSRSPALRQIASVRQAKLPLSTANTPLVLLSESRIPATGGPSAAAANRSRQFHAQLAFTLAPPPARGAAGAFNFTVGARVLMGGSGDHADVTLEGTAAGSSGPAQISALRVTVDKRRVGGFTPRDVQGGRVPLPVPPAAAWLLPDKVRCWLPLQPGSHIWLSAVRES